MTQKDIKLLWGRAGNRCAICQKELALDTSAKDASFLLGEQAHIVGEKEDAARGKSPLSLDERNSYHNLILLCPTHHTEIDKNEADWPVEKVYLLKSKHELWVKESLSSTVDLQTKASELIVSSIIDSVVTLCHLENWSSWTSFALGPDPTWRLGFSEDFYKCSQKLIAAIWPAEFDELRRASITLAKLCNKASAKFHEHSELKDDLLVTIKFYKEGGYNENYDEDLELYNTWIQECHKLIYEATKAANWFADIVRRDINPTFFAVKGRFLIEDGPFEDMSFKTFLVQFTEAEKAALPNSLANQK